MNFIERYFWILFVGLVLLLVVLIPLSIHRFNDRVAKCESLGGLYLENSHIAGKIVYHNYYCVRKDAVIGVD